MGQPQYLGVGNNLGWQEPEAISKSGLQRPSPQHRLARSAPYSNADSNERVGMLSTSSSRIMDVGTQPANYACRAKCLASLRIAAPSLGKAWPGAKSLAKAPEVGEHQA
jgi:hypothetical protein